MLFFLSSFDKKISWKKIDSYDSKLSSRKDKYISIIISRFVLFTLYK